MDLEQLRESLWALKDKGKSIRDIVAELAVHPSRVQRALKAVQRRSDEAFSTAGKHQAASRI